MSNLLSIYCFFKNERDVLPEILPTWLPFLAGGGELVLVDTGSTDGSLEFAREVARSRPAGTGIDVQVHELPWPDPTNWAAITEQVMNLCTRPWRLRIDADEKLAGDPRALESVLNNLETLCVCQEEVRSCGDSIVHVSGSIPVAIGGLLLGLFEPETGVHQYRSRLHRGAWTWRYRIDPAPAPPAGEEGGVFLMLQDWICSVIHTRASIRPEALARMEGIYELAQRLDGPLDALVEVEVDAVAHVESWDAFTGHSVLVLPFYRKGNRIADQLNEIAAGISGPAWVGLAELNEGFRGDGEKARRLLELYADRLHRPQHQLSASVRWTGPDFADTKLHRPKLWFVPRGSTFGAEWEFRFELDVVVTSRKPTYDNALCGVDHSVFAIRRLTSIRGIAEVERRERIIAAMDDAAWTEAERQHYAASLLPEWSPLLSLCVIARGVDESLLRMLRSARGHFSEVVVLLTRFAGDERADAFACDAARGALAGAVAVPLIVASWHDPDSFQLEDGTWCIGNFDRARQRCFDLAHGMFRMFLDSDDTLEWTLGEPVPQLWDIVAKNFLNDTSVAELAVVPMQDLLGLGSEARLNRPGVAAGNWTWRLREGLFDEALAARLRRLVEVSERLTPPPAPPEAPVPEAVAADPGEPPATS